MKRLGHSISSSGKYLLEIYDFNGSLIEPFQLVVEEVVEARVDLVGEYQRLVEDTGSPRNVPADDNGLSSRYKFDTSDLEGVAADQSLFVRLDTSNASLPLTIRVESSESDNDFVAELYKVYDTLSPAEIEYFAYSDDSEDSLDPELHISDSGIYLLQINDFYGDQIEPFDLVIEQNSSDSP